MNPIYKFELSDGNTTQRAFPIYKDDLSKDFEKESNQEFFRAKLSGKLTFESEDYTFIVSRAFDTQFILEIFISYDAGQTWTSYWRGTFWKTDCEFDDDAQTVDVKPTVWDQYNAVLAGMEKEYNLIELLPQIAEVKADKRAMIQIYVPGQDSVACFLSSMWWEQECEPESDESVLTQAGNLKPNFALCTGLRTVEVSGNMSPALPPVFIGAIPTETTNVSYEYINGAYKFYYAHAQSGGGQRTIWRIIRVTDSVTMWERETTNVNPPTVPYSVTLTPASSEASGNVALYIHDINVYGRLILDVDTILSTPTYELAHDDFVINNRNYSRVIGYSFANSIFFSQRFSNEPTQWGIFQPGIYYDQPAILGAPELYPVSRNSWGYVSIWFSYQSTDYFLEQNARREFTLKDAFPLSSVISVLLAKIAPGITHEATTDYSQFLYGTNPITEVDQRLLITPKSNIVSANYDQPAQKAPITLKNVTDMLRDCFRCYWFIDEQNRFRIEHIQYFRKGGSYYNTPVVGIDLTTQQVSRNGKPWTFGRNQYQFNKPEMAARYQFGWMDDVTQLFEGYPIDIVSKYVNPDNIEQIDVSGFTSDIDYVLLNPEAISKDGFVLLAGVPVNYLETSIRQYGTSTLDIVFNLDLSDFIGQTVTVEVASSVAGVKFGQTDPSLEFEQIGVLENADTTYSFTFVVTKRFLALYDASANFVGTLQGIYGISFRLPYFNYTRNLTDHYLQNGYAAFCYLQQYYAYDMPARIYSIDGVLETALGVKRLRNQSIHFPLLNDPNIFESVKTSLGNGMIEKLSVNLSSRNANATLNYDIEQ